MTLVITIAETHQRVAATRSRRAKIETLAEQLAALDHEEVEAGVHFLSGKIRQGRTGIGFASLNRASVPPTSASGLSLTELDQALEALAGLRGAGVARARQIALQDLFSRLTADEQDFVRKLLLGQLRQGILVGLMMDAVARAAGLPVGEVRRAAMFAGDLGLVARMALEEGSVGLASFGLQLFAPVAPMLAQTAEDVRAAIDLLGEAAFEWKLDGARVQLHREGEQVKVYTRAGNEITARLPEVVEAAAALPAHSLVLDGEVIALDREQRPLPFQVTMRRFGRKSSLDKMRRDLPLSVFFFDCLRRDQQDLVSLPTRERFAALDQLLPEPLRVPRLVTGDAEQAFAFYQSALAQGHEGVMAKSLAASYEAGNRGSAWLKIKRSHTLDLVVLAAEWGNGRRQGWLSNLHLGAPDEEGGFVMLGKTFKGLTDATLQWQTEELLKRETQREGHIVHVRPELVVEIAFNDIQTSPRYPGGLALRFARVKQYRRDKTSAEADTLSTVRGLFQSQTQHGYG